MRKGKLIFLVFLAFFMVVLESVAGQGHHFWTGASDFGIFPKWATHSDFNNRLLVFCRGFYEQNDQPRSVYRSNMNGWYVDYPGGDNNFLIRLSELTKTRINRDTGGKPVYAVVRLDGEFLFQCPLVFFSDVESIELKESEISNLRKYLEKGGFIWADDFWGDEGLETWESQISKVLPPGKYRTIDINSSHSIMNQVYAIPEIPQIPNYGLWVERQLTSERGKETEVVSFKGIEDEKGRLMVVATHNTDIAETWERESNREFFYKFSPVGYRIGINIFIYALTH